MLSRFRSTRTLGLAAALVAAPIAGGPRGEAVAQALPRETFAREPRTPLETWEAATYLIQVGQPRQAASYLKKFLDANPDDPTMLAVRDQYGAGSILRLADDAATRSYARPLADRMAQATIRYATDPARIAQSIESLSRSPEEQAVAVDQLRQAGPYAVPSVVRALNAPGLDPSARSLIAENLGRLDRSAVPSMIAALDAPDPPLVAEVAQALGKIGDPRAVPALTYLAARTPPSTAKPQADQAIFRITGRPFADQPDPPSKVLADEARKYHLHGYRFPGDPVVIWSWDVATKAPVPTSTTVEGAEGKLGIKAARQAVDLDPGSAEARVNLISLGLDHAPDDWKDIALKAGPEDLGRVVRLAIADGRPDLAARAIELLGQVDDRDALVVQGQSSPLVEALSSTDRRVRFAAAEALVKLDWTRRFVGSSRVVPILARFVSAQGEPRAVIIDGNGERAAQTAGFFRALGYETQIASTGAQGFVLASGSSDVELIAVDPNLINDPWRLPDVLGNFEADPRTTRIPVFLVGPLSILDRLKPHLESFPEARYLVTPTELSALKRQIDLGFTALGVRPLSDAERSDYARRASSLLARIARQPGSPFEPDLVDAEPALALALNGAFSSPDAAVALGNVPGQDAQRTLADVALDASRPPVLRTAVAEQLARNIRRFGPRLANDQERRLVEEVATEPDVTLHDALGTVLTALQPGPDASASRVTKYRSMSP